MEDKIFTKFQHIEQFRNIYSYLKSRAQYLGKDEDGNNKYDNTIVPPPITFYGTVKLHGTNSSVCERNNVRWFQSRNNIIDIGNDNAGFANFARQNKEAFDNIFNKIYSEYKQEENKRYCIFGEWFGESIQKGVAISQLSKRYAIFDVIIYDDNNDYEFHAPKEFIKTLVDPEHDIYNVFLFKTYEIVVDFEKPAELLTGKLSELTLSVEQHCPAGEYFGVDGVGEGIVWNYREDDGSVVHRFKTKGEKHSSSKVKSVKKLVSLTPEEFNNITKFVDYALTENRLNQGLQEVFPDNNITQQGIGNFIGWCVGDVMREEADTICQNKFPPQFVVNELRNKARKFILERI